MTLHWRPLLLMIVTGLLGAASSIYLHQWALRQDDEQIRALVSFRSEWRATDLSWKLEATGHAVASLAALIAADPDISLERFRRINAEPLRRLKSMTGIGWVPRVPGGERERFEAAIRAEGLAGFRILESRTGGFVPVAERDEYFPLIHGWIFDGPAAVPGLDAFANTYIRAAGLAARDSGDLTMTIPLRSDVTGLTTLQPMAPVYRGDGVPAGIEERRARLRGYVIGRVPLVDALNRAIEHTPEISEDIYFAHGTGALTEGRAQTFAEYHMGGRAFAASNKTIELAGLPGIVVVKPVRVYNTEWTAVFHFPPDLLAAERAKGLWGLLIAGLLATGGIMAFFGYEARQTVRSERLVAERTADLRRESAERLRVERAATAIIEQSPFAIVGLHPDRRVMLWNQAAERIFGYTADEVVGGPYPLVPPEGQAEFDRIIERVSAGERLVDVGVSRRRKEGTLVDIVFSGAPLHDAEGGLAGFVFVLQDVTERRAIEAQLRQSQKMEAIGQLSGGIAHDFNNMLAAIIGNLEIALDEKRDVAPIHKLIETAIDVAARGGELVQRLLAFARRQMLVPRLIDVAAVIGGVVPILKRTLGESIAIDSRSEPGLWPVMADPAQLDSALLNLAINARDAMPRGGTLTITANNITIDPDMAPVFPDLVLGDYVVVAVADTGTGMPPEVVARAFEPFFTTKETGKGTGLGLSMVYGFMRQSGGTAKIYSEVGHGTTMHLYLPRAAYAAAEAPAADAARTAPGGRERVLVVEDNPDVREVACTMLVSLGYQVTPAGDATQALALIASEAPFDLLFSDVVMPGTSGIELADEVRRHHPRMKILLTSGFASPVAIRDQAKEAGIELLAKPYRRIALAVKVREVLDQGA